MDRKRTLYQCPVCGHVDHDEQDGTGHWEQGTSYAHSDVPGWSYWFLLCSRCGVASDMKEVSPPPRE